MKTGPDTQHIPPSIHQMQNSIYKFTTLQQLSTFSKILDQSAQNKCSILLASCDVQLIFSQCICIFFLYRWLQPGQHKSITSSQDEFPLIDQQASINCCSMTLLPLHCFKLSRMQYHHFHQPL